MWNNGSEKEWTLKTLEQIEAQGGTLAPVILRALESYTADWQRSCPAESVALRAKKLAAEPKITVDQAKILLANLWQEVAALRTTRYLLASSFTLNKVTSDFMQATTEPWIKHAKAHRLFQELPIAEQRRGQSDLFTHRSKTRSLSTPLSSNVIDISNRDLTTREGVLWLAVVTADRKRFDAERELHHIPTVGSVLQNSVKIDDLPLTIPVVSDLISLTHESMRVRVAIAEVVANQKG